MTDSTKPAAADPETGALDWLLNAYNNARDGHRRDWTAESADALAAARLALVLHVDRLRAEAAAATRRAEEAERDRDEVKTRTYEPIKRWIEENAPEAVRRMWVLMCEAEYQRDEHRVRAKSAESALAAATRALATQNGLALERLERAVAAESALAEAERRAGRMEGALRERLDACVWTTLGELRAQIDKWILVGSEKAGTWVRGVSWGGLALNQRDKDEAARAALSGAGDGETKEEHHGE